MISRWETQVSVFWEVWSEKLKKMSKLTAVFRRFGFFKSTTQRQKKDFSNPYFILHSNFSHWGSWNSLLTPLIGNQTQTTESYISYLDTLLYSKKISNESLMEGLWSVNTEKKYISQVETILLTHFRNLWKNRLLKT